MILLFLRFALSLILLLLSFLLIAHPLHLKDILTFFAISCQLQIIVVAIDYSLNSQPLPSAATSTIIGTLLDPIESWKSKETNVLTFGQAIIPDYVPSNTDANIQL